MNSKEKVEREWEKIELELKFLVEDIESVIREIKETGNKYGEDEIASLQTWKEEIENFIN